MGYQAQLWLAVARIGLSNCVTLSWPQHFFSDFKLRAEFCIARADQFTVVST